MNYGAPHEDFVWAIRSEEGVTSAFEKVYNDKDLIVSFDAINYGFANRTNLPPNNPWPHQDQVRFFATPRERHRPNHASRILIGRAFDAFKVLSIFTRTVQMMAA